MTRAGRGSAVTTSWSGLGLLAMVVALAVALTACATGSATSDQDSTTDPAGAALYVQNCSRCHGVDLQGTDRGPSQLSEVYKPDHHPDASYRAAIAEGVQAHHWPFGDMAPVEGLTADQVDAIIGYIRAQQDEHGFEPYPPR